MKADKLQVPNGAIKTQQET